MRISLREVAYPAVLSAGIALTILGGLAFAGLALRPLAREALASLPDHPSGGLLYRPSGGLLYRPSGGLLYRPSGGLLHRPSGGGNGAELVADAPLRGLGGAVAGSLAAVAALVAARRTLRRNPPSLALFLGIFFATVPLECLRGAIAWLQVTDHSVAASLALCRIVWWGRFTGLLALLGAALAALEPGGRRPAILAPVLLAVALAMALAVPVDRTVFLAQLTWKLGDEQGVWFVTLVVGVLAPVSLVIGALVRRQSRLYLQAANLMLLLAARELLFLDTRTVQLAIGFGCLLAGATWYVAAVRRP